ncbi:MAG TPA: hypothetical protein VF013_00365 [Candidatus Limnocylindria bacterium]
MARSAEPRAITPPDPLNSYQPASFRSVIITAAAILAVLTALWLAYSAALNNPELQQEMDGRQQIQGPLYPAPEPGNH